MIAMLNKVRYADASDATGPLRRTVPSADAIENDFSERAISNIGTRKYVI
jgi:hypothetical protein